MTELQVPVGENILLSAFRDVNNESATKTSDELMAEYERHFKTTVPTPPVQPQIFERFSLIDPTIRMTVKSSTSAS